MKKKKIKEYQLTDKDARIIANAEKAYWAVLEKAYPHPKNQYMWLQAEANFLNASAEQASQFIGQATGKIKLKDINYGD